MSLLEGIRVIDFTQAHAGSLATMILADFGAEIIKIERAGVGDLARYWAPMKEGNSGYYAYLNRGKKSISLNASAPEGHEILVKLLETADVVTENFKFGSMERMGLSYEKIKEINPNIIYASLNGFGQTGPLKKSIGLDLQLQAMSGMMDRTGFADGPPTKAGAALADQLSGTYMALGIILSLIHREKTSVGQKVDIAILDALVSVLEAFPVMYSLNGKVPPRMGNGEACFAPYDTFPVSDGYIAVGVATDRQWEKFCHALGLPELLAEEQYCTNLNRCAHYNTLRRELEQALAGRKKLETAELLQEAGVPCSVVQTVKEAMDTRQMKERMLLHMEDSVLGDITMPNTAIKLEKTAARIETGAPLLGEHTLQYLQQLGYSQKQLKELEANKIIQIQ